MGEIDVNLGDIVGVEGVPAEDPPRRAVAEASAPRAARPEPAAAAGHVPRHPGCRAPLPQALPRPADDRGDARGLPAARPHDHRDPPVPRRARVRRGRDADAAAALRRRLRRAVRDPYSRELDRDVYLRIATELYLKRLIVGGLEKVYELAKDFRNESVSYKNNPEFTMLEWYEAYADYRDTMDAHRGACRGGRRGGARDDEGHVHGARDRLRAAVAPDQAGRGAAEQRGSGRVTRTSCRKRLEDRGTDTHADKTWAQLVDHALSSYVEPSLIQPTILYDYPVELSPFARAKDDDPTITERFEYYVGGMELGNAYSELNDSDEQAQRFAMQAEEGAGGNVEAEQGRSRLRRGAVVRDAADRRPRPRDRPARDGARGQGHDPRRDSVPAAPLVVTAARGCPCGSVPSGC